MVSTLIPHLSFFFFTLYPAFLPFSFLPRSLFSLTTHTALCNLRLWVLVMQIHTFLFMYIFSLLPPSPSFILPYLASFTSYTSLLLCPFFIFLSFLFPINLSSLPSSLFSLQFSLLLFSSFPTIPLFFPFPFPLYSKIILFPSLSPLLPATALSLHPSLPLHIPPSHPFFSSLFSSSHQRTRGRERQARWQQQQPRRWKPQQQQRRRRRQQQQRRHGPLQVSMATERERVRLVEQAGVCRGAAPAGAAQPPEPTAR